MEKLNILQDELRGSFDFFCDFTNLEQGSRGFGLTADCTKKPQVASIASVGFALTAWVIAVEREYLSPKAALGITRNTLRTLLDHASHHRGFFAHYLYMENGERYKKCEYSTIDTALCLNGVVTAAAYFHDEQINEITQQLLRRIDWNFIIFEKEGKTLFRMAYNPDKDGDYVDGQPGYIYQWDMAAEQKMMYLLAADWIEPSVARNLYQGFSRDTGIYDNQTIIINPGGNLFAYQFTEAWLDVFQYIDPDGVDWFNNTRLAILANRDFCIRQSKYFHTYHANSWGISAGDGPKGYGVCGSEPCLGKPRHNGTVTISAALAAMPFSPELTLALMHYLYDYHPQTWGRYGFFDAYNLDVSPPWFSHSIYGINKGCSMLMIENYLSRRIWEIYSNSPTIQKSLDILGFKKREG